MLATHCNNCMLDWDIIGYLCFVNKHIKTNEHIFDGFGRVAAQFVVDFAHCVCTEPKSDYRESSIA